MKELLGGILLAVLVAVGSAFLIYHMSAYFAPKYAELNRTVMKESQAFQDGAIRTIRNYQTEYLTATDPAAKAALRSAILHELNSFNKDNLPYDLKTFVETL